MRVETMRSMPRTLLPRRLLILPALTILAGSLTLGSSSAGTAAAAGTPVFRQYHGPSSPKDVQGRATGTDLAGDPSLGYDPTTDQVLFMANTSTWRVGGFGASNDQASWTDITEPVEGAQTTGSVEGAQTTDAMLWRDPVTGRTFINQLMPQGGSLQAYTDDNGKTYTRSTLGSGIGLSFGHQSVTTGRPAAGQNLLPQPIGYPNYVYYCTNDVYAADCSVSIDGGRNFLLQTPVYAGNAALGVCSPLFGHIQTDPRSGTLYLAPDGCSGTQMLFASEDNTLHWTGHTLPGSTDGDSGHPSVAVGRQDGAVYYAWGSADGYRQKTGRTHVAVSLTHGKSWTLPLALGGDLGVVTSRFPVVVAGDAGRAAVAFLGSKAPGDPHVAPDVLSPRDVPYAGTWNLYVSFTVDGGRTWKTYNATPSDPIQRGPICADASNCLGGNNLRDFNGMVLDRNGRVVIALADGALSKTDTFARGLAKATIVRQIGGPSLYGPPAR